MSENNRDYIIESTYQDKRLQPRLENNIPVPTATIEQAPVRYYKANLEYAKIIAGWLSWLVQPQAWKDTDEYDSEPASQIAQFLEGIQLEILNCSDVENCIETSVYISNILSNVSNNANNILINYNDIQAIETTLNNYGNTIGQLLNDVTSLQADLAVAQNDIANLQSGKRNLVDNYLGRYLNLSQTVTAAQTVSAINFTNNLNNGFIDYGVQGFGVTTLGLYEADCHVTLALPISLNSNNVWDVTLEIVVFKGSTTIRHANRLYQQADNTTDVRLVDLDVNALVVLDSGLDRIYTRIYNNSDDDIEILGLETNNGVNQILSNFTVTYRGERP